MAESSPKRAYRIIVGVLVVATLGVLCFAGAILFANRPLSASAVSATLTALPRSSPTITPTPTPVSTIPAANPELLLCQRQAGQLMRVRNMVGAVNISDNHVFLLTWFSLNREVRDLDDAVVGVLMAFEVALELWDENCAVFDRVQIDVYDGPGDRQRYRLTVHAQMDDLLKWRAKEIGEAELLGRVEVVQPTPVP